MQDIVDFLLKNPAVLKEIIDGNACLLGIDQEKTETVVDSIRLLGKRWYGGGFWI
ncbi:MULTISPECIES: competence pheromone ComX [Bacillus]|uniref:ComX pheromone n=1 Tax=Bacillus glycinifermentans TaxID=1664069 RepID=A0AAJ4D3L7_9BACI|nr:MULTISPECIES: competence pheromone ComX [Bacillus]KKB72881.1 competence protein [Bacillus sp. TH008]MDU0072762.1 competence pheromone ComX [Bacillus sp. IG6]MED8020556.1 competence pheromone ComX [Bacillus glycinifermentans]QAT66720.1 competence pheromone ComX [Bacillus glycinifermentans]WKB76477.1 competence pheromone ComX [Bacillus glycinifermentans]